MTAIKSILRGIFKSTYDIAFSKEKIKKEEEPVFITIEEALQDSSLVRKMHNQLTNAKLTIGSSNKYVAGLRYKNHQYYILGTNREWESFFVMRNTSF